LSVYFNLTTSWKWRRPPVGIVRVERELAAHLVGSSTETCCCVLDEDGRTFRQLTPQEVERLLDDGWCKSEAEAKVGTVESRGTAVGLRSVTKRLFGHLPLLAQDLLRVVRQHTRGDSRVGGASGGPPTTGRPIRPTSRDRFLSIGLDWNYGLGAISALKEASGVGVALASYDTIPVDYPEVSSRDTRDLFRDYFVQMAAIADGIFAISETTKADLGRLYRRLAVRRTPRIVAITLGCNPPRWSEEVPEEVKALMGGQGFVLYVSTIEARKNHRILVHVWQDLYREHGTNVPRLVFLGMPGWGVGDLMDELRNMDVFLEGMIRIINHGSDALLASLYQHCLFAVFPSIYEGWGLGAVEAMSYGKICLVSDTPGLREATHGLCPTMHPFDFPAWRAAVTRYWTNRDDREALEGKIRASFRLRTWSDFGRDFEAFLATL
jgi:glycosyltransferase involved in cell wall biosynthesis